MSTGIEARHSRACASRPENGGAKCNCTPTHQAQVYDRRTGKTVKKTFATVTAAKRWRQDAIVALRNGTMTTDRGPTLNEALDRWIEALPTEQTRSGDPYKPGTLRDYERCIRRYGVRTALGHLRVHEITTADAQRWIDKLVRDGNLAPATIDAAITPLKAFYRRAQIRVGGPRTNPFVGVMKPAVRCEIKSVATPMQAAAMIDALDGRDRDLWAVAFYSGLRRGELIGLRRDDIDLAKGVIQVRRGWDMLEGEIEPKSRKGKRAVPIPAALRDHLDELLLQVGNGPLFGTPRWIAKTNERVRDPWSAAGLPVLTLHEARHTYASLMIAAGVNAKALSTFMGHATIAITLDLYGKLFPGSEDEAAALLDSYLARAVGASIVAQSVAHPPEVPA